MATELFLAFDDLRERGCPAVHDLCGLAASGLPFGIKINLDELISPVQNFANTFAHEIRPLGRPLFADLKMWNGSRTMEWVAKDFIEAGFDFINVYAQADKELQKAVRATEGTKTKILGLTVLSHYGDKECQKWYRRSLREAVRDFSQHAVDAGCHGIILPGTMLDVVKDLNTIKVATGIRPTWYKDDRHEQEVTPADTVKGGAHFAVCGSPILKQATMEGKIVALEKVLTEMRAVV